MNLYKSITLSAAILAMLLSAQIAFGDSLVQVRLVDPLDEPEYYCLDVSGWGEHLKPDDPLQAHTCKVSDNDDQFFSIKGDSILVGTTGRCLEIAGTRTPLPGAAIVARECAGGPMQAFTIEEDGRISTQDADLCLAVGDRSAEAFGPSHVWRVLTVEQCDAVSAELMTWQVGL